MPWKLSLRLAELLVTAILALALVAAWRAERSDRTQLAAELTAAKQSLTEADARQHDRDSQLLQTLATLAAEKRTVATPQQIVHDLPNQITLPTPITLEPTPAERHATPNHPGDKPTKSEPQAILPAEDLKPLYDFTLDCKACQSKLAASQSDLTDEKSKAAVLTKERDQAVRAAKGGSILQRVARAAKWLAIGVALGAVASHAAR
jgi:hypothetical protein